MGNRKIKVLTGIVLVATSVVSADVLTMTDDKNFIDSTNGSDYSKALKNISGGDLTWDIGETFGMTFDMTVTDPDLSLGGGSPTIAIGVGDNSEGLGFGIGQWDASKDWIVAGIDASAPGAGNFGINPNSGSPRIDSAVADANDLRDDGETASFAMTVLRADIDTYDFSVTWAGVTDVWSIDAATTGTGDTVDTFHEVLLRVNESGSTTGNELAITNLSMTVIPEPATLGLISAVGVGLLFIRRFFQI